MRMNRSLFAVLIVAVLLLGVGGGAPQGGGGVPAIGKSALLALRVSAGGEEEQRAGDGGGLEPPALQVTAQGGDPGEPLVLVIGSLDGVFLGMPVAVGRWDAASSWMQEFVVPAALVGRSVTLSVISRNAAGDLEVSNEVDVADAGGTGAGEADVTPSRAVRVVDSEDPGPGEIDAPRTPRDGEPGGAPIGGAGHPERSR